MFVYIYISIHLHWFITPQKSGGSLPKSAGHEFGGAAALLRRVQGGSGSATLVEQGWGGEQSHDAPWRREDREVDGDFDGEKIYNDI